MGEQKLISADKLRILHRSPKKKVHRSPERVLEKGLESSEEQRLGEGYGHEFRSKVKGHQELGWFPPHGMAVIHSIFGKWKVCPQYGYWVWNGARPQLIWEYHYKNEKYLIR